MENHPATEAPQMIDTPTGPRPETEQERIDRVKAAMASIEARRQDDPHGLRPETVISGPDHTAPHAYRNGDVVIYKDEDRDKPDREARVTGVDGPNVYVRFTDTNTQKRVPHTALWLEERPPLPGAATLARVANSTEYAPLEEGEEVVILSTREKAIVLIADRKGGRVFLQLQFGGEVWLSSEHVVRAVALSRQEAADRFINAILDSPRAIDPEPEAETPEASGQGLRVTIQRLHPQAKIPAQGKASDAGYDLTSISENTLAPGERVLFRTGIAMAIPEGYVGLVKPRSGLAVKHGIDTLAGVIDAGYRGEIIVALLNTGEEAVEITVGDRIAQLLVQPVLNVAFEEGDLPPSERGTGGFGSTGRGAL